MPAVRYAVEGGEEEQRINMRKTIIDTNKNVKYENNRIINMLCMYAAVGDRIYRVQR